MSGKLNIEDQKFLIPDYITGSLNDTEKAAVEDALKQSAELRQFYDETRGTLEFVSTVKFDEPSLQYWNSLLPRIHEKIEARHAKRSLWAGIPALWKIIVPVAAILLFFVFYQILRSPEKQITKDDNNTIRENVVKDSSKQVKTENKEEIKQPVEQQEEKLAKQDDNNIRQPRTVRRNHENREVKIIDNNVAQDNNHKNENEMNSSSDNSNEDFASVDPDDISIIASASPGGIDEETEHELNKLDNNEKDELLQDLLRSNL
jgi:hypothetical protein